MTSWKRPRRDGDSGWPLFFTFAGIAMICVIVLYARAPH
jgi:hypothetical protein